MIAWLAHRYPTEEEAIEAATAAKADYDREGESMELTCRGNPYLVAGISVKLEGFRPNVRTDWRCSKVTHTYNDLGYLSRVELETF